MASKNETKKNENIPKPIEQTKKTEIVSNSSEKKPFALTLGVPQLLIGALILIAIASVLWVTVISPGGLIHGLGGSAPTTISNDAQASDTLTGVGQDVSGISGSLDEAIDSIK